MTEQHRPAARPQDGRVTKKLPFNECPRAVTRVTNPLPAPEHCPHCGSQVDLVENGEIYGRNYGEWPWAYLCSSYFCGAYVGVHPGTAIPLGTLATEEIRTARKQAKAAFSRVYQPGRLSRSQAYQWLAARMGIRNVGECHIGWFDVKQCQRVVSIIEIDGRYSAKETS